MTIDDDTAARVLLLSLPGVGPARARWLLRTSSAVEVLEALRAGRLPPDLERAPAGVTPRLVSRWTSAARVADPVGLVAEIDRRSIEIVQPGHPSWPYAQDPDPPVLLFCVGNTSLLGARPAVAVVGTRRCTAIGREVAQRFGQGLAENGVPVVSGLASGVDGAAHRATLAAGGAAVGIVGTGLDVVYPRSNADLWHRVASEGVLVTEAGLGARPERWRFPARNRLIAGVVDVVVVVESHAEGGSLLTVGEAAERGVTVMAVPGSVTSSASAGTNQLLVEGAFPACSVADILGVLDLSAVDGLPSAADESATDDLVAQHRLGPLARRLLDEVAAGAAHVDQLVASTREPIPAVLAELTSLEALGLINLDGSTAVRVTPDADPSNHKQ